MGRAGYRAFLCISCGRKQDRYRNARKCSCGGTLRVDRFAVAEEESIRYFRRLAQRIRALPADKLAQALPFLQALEGALKGLKPWMLS